MAGGAGIWDAGPLRFRGRDESERVSGDVVVLDGLLDMWHVTGNALASGAVLRGDGYAH